MQPERVLSIARTTLEGAALTGVLLAISTTPVFAAPVTIDPTSSASGDWLEVFVGFGLLLVIGLGGLWFTQHEMKFR